MHQAKRASLDSPRGFEGVVSTHGGVCAICSTVYEFPKPFVGTHHARRYLRMFQGWSYLPRWGWVCRKCRVRTPGLSQQYDEAYRNVTGKEPTNGLRRAQISISFDGGTRKKK